jgi:hypothetical protein
MDIKNKSDLLKSLVLIIPWGKGYAGVVYVSVQDFEKGTQFPHNLPQLSYDPEIDAIIIMQGQFTIYDDNGYMDAGYDVLPHIEQLSLPANPLINIIIKREGLISKEVVPCEYVQQSGKRTFDYGPTDEQLERIKYHRDLGGLKPLSDGDFTSVFSYGRVSLALIPKNNNIGLLIGGYMRDTEEKQDKRDFAFFERHR